MNAAMRIGTVLAIVFGTPAVAGVSSYHLTVLGGGTSAFAWAINSSGLIVGAVNGNAAVIDEHGYKLIAPAGGNGSYARSVNDSGEILIEAFSAPYGKFTSLIFNGGSYSQVVGPLGGNVSAYGLNNPGQIAGTNYGAGGYPSVGIAGSNGLFAVGGSMLIGINDLGHATGTGGSNGSAIIVDGKGVTNIGTLGGYSALGWHINNKDQVVGQSYTQGYQRQMGFIFQNGKMLPIEQPDWRDAIAYSINDDGTTIGDAETVSSFRQAWVYTDGVISKLNDLTPDRGNFDIRFARGINAKGQIVGFGYDQSSYIGAAYLLTPIAGVPEPSAWLLMILGFGIIGYAKRRGYEATSKSNLQSC